MGHLFKQSGTLLAERAQALVLLGELRGVFPQSALLSDQLPHLVSKAPSFGTNALGAQGPQFVEAGGVQSVRGVEIRKDDRLDFRDEFGADVIVGAKPFNELLRKETDVLLVGLVLAKSNLRDFAVGPL